MLGPILAVAVAAPAPDATVVRGMTISCQTWGIEWASDDLGSELDELAALGVNWIAIHPYASIGADGAVRWRVLDPKAPPEWIVRPIREAHARGLSILIKPHLAYWGSPFRWRGEIDFGDPAARERFFNTYERWIVDVARVARDADGFVVATELDRLVEHHAAWRRIIRAVRSVTSARLTYAANWDSYQRVPFWGDLDAVGVQAYFPLSEATPPTESELRRAWQPILRELRATSERTGKPVVLTELGYDQSSRTAHQPWKTARAAERRNPRAQKTQAHVMAVTLAVLEPELDWLRGAFLWKWFVGDAPGESFVLDVPHMRRVIGSSWRRAPSP